MITIFLFRHTEPTMSVKYAQPGQGADTGLLQLLQVGIGRSAKGIFKEDTKQTHPFS